MTWVIVPAAGSGQRFGAPIPKQHVLIDGRSLLDWTIERLANVPQITGLMVVLAPDDTRWSARQHVAGKALLTATGGGERADSVLAGLMALPTTVADTEFVLVHDAARPCVRASDVENLIRAIVGTDGGLLAAPVRDTLKRHARQLQTLHVAETVPRADLWRAMTPQAFRRGALIAALRDAKSKGIAPTDESQAMEAQGLRPLLVEGAEDNIKVTTAHDLILAQFILRTTCEH